MQKSNQAKKKMRQLSIPRKIMYRSGKVLSDSAVNIVYMVTIIESPNTDIRVRGGEGEKLDDSLVLI